MTFASNRLHQLASGKIPCSEKSCPPEGEGEGKELSSQKAKDIAIGRLLIKQESRLAQERSFLTQNVAFTTARTLTSNAGQKTIQKEWMGKGGTEEFQKRRAGLIIQSAAEIAGIPPEEVERAVNAAAGSSSSSSNQPPRTKMAVGVMSAGRSMRSPKCSAMAKKLLSPRCPKHPKKTTHRKQP